MAFNREHWLRDMRRENRNFGILLVIGFVAALAIGFAIGMWTTNPMLFSVAPASQTAPAQPPAPG